MHTRQRSPARVHLQLCAIRAGIAHSDCVALVVTYILENRWRDIVLVGRRFGGTVVQRVAKELFARIARTLCPGALISTTASVCSKCYGSLPGVAEAKERQRASGR